MNKRMVFAKYLRKIFAMHVPYVSDTIVSRVNEKIMKMRSVWQAIIWAIKNRINQTCERKKDYFGSFTVNRVPI